MANILILYGTTDGTTRRVAQRMAEVFARAGQKCTVLDASAPGASEAILGADGVVVGGGIRYGHHPKELERVVRENREALSRRPNAFFSVCMSAGGPGAKPDNARKYIEDFSQRTGWQPVRATSVAGACLYTQYTPFIRFLMKLFMTMGKGETDTTRDWEYTDWEAVERYAAEFVRQLERVPA